MKETGSFRVGPLLQKAFPTHATPLRGAPPLSPISASPQPQCLAQSDVPKHNRSEQTKMHSPEAVDTHFPSWDIWWFCRSGTPCCKSCSRTGKLIHGL